MVDDAYVSSDERWLAATWPFVREHLPAAPGRVLELGCGPLGGFVPAMRSEGYDALGIDPEAPVGPDYERTEFERHQVTRRAQAVVACTSLHHVTDLDDIVRRVTSALEPNGLLIVVEWASERFDETTARWCFARLADVGEHGDAGWLHRHRDQWIESGQSWDSYFTTWLQNEQLHSSRDIVRALRPRFDTRLLTEGPYLFADLDGVTPAEEQAAIDAEQIQATGIRYVGEATAAT